MYKEINLEMGLRIRAKRKLIGFSSEKLAALMNISNQFLCDVEAGKKSFSYTNLKKVCEILCVSSDYVILGKESTDEYKNITEIIENIPLKYIPVVEASLSNIVNVIAIVKNS